uniref:Uncharacterized protein n=1 Tax=Panthera tigris altaica TaxID=74533 RepID=A0A8C9JJ78_PANTA
MASAAAAVRLTVAAAGFAGRSALQALKHNMEPQVKQVFQSLPNSAFSDGYYRGGNASLLPLSGIGVISLRRLCLHL